MVMEVFSFRYHFPLYTYNINNTKYLKIKIRWRCRSQSFGYSSRSGTLYRAFGFFIDFSAFSRQIGRRARFHFSFRRRFAINGRKHEPLLAFGGAASAARRWLSHAGGPALPLFSFRLFHFTMASATAPRAAKATTPALYRRRAFPVIRRRPTPPAKYTRCRRKRYITVQPAQEGEYECHEAISRRIVKISGMRHCRPLLPVCRACSFLSSTPARISKQPRARCTVDNTSRRPRLTFRASPHSTHELGWPRNFLRPQCHDMLVDGARRGFDAYDFDLPPTQMAPSHQRRIRLADARGGSRTLPAPRLAASAMPSL